MRVRQIDPIAIAVRLEMAAVSGKTVSLELVPLTVRVGLGIRMVRPGTRYAWRLKV
jgi:hypothetical protein